MPYSGSYQENSDRLNAKKASEATATATDTTKLTDVGGLAAKMSAPKRFWHMPTSRWVEVDDPDYKKLMADKDSPAKSITSAKSISTSKAVGGK